MQNTRVATRAVKTAADIPTDDHIVGMVVKARAAMARYADEIVAHGQARIDEAVTALAWSIYEPARARRLAEIAVEVTGIGEVEKISLPADLVQLLPNPVTRETTTRLMQLVDLVVVTGSQVNVKGAYKSGTPAIGVGLGNAPVIIDTSADLADAAHKIMLSKTFDHATSCSSENALVIGEEIYDMAIAGV